MGLEMRCKHEILIMLLTSTILIGYLSLASTYVYNPFSIDLNPVQPPIHLINPGNPNVNVIIGKTKTSANITLTNNLALKIYDEDENGYIYVEGPSANVNLGNGEYYEVKWKLHITHFEDPIGDGMIILDVYFLCDLDYYLASIIYYGSYVRAALGLSTEPDPASEGQSPPFSINPNQEHNFKIRLERSIDGATLIIEWFIDDVKIYDYTLNILMMVTVFQSYFGWLNQDRLYLKFYAYIDDVEMSISEDFEDGIDNLFTEHRTGNTGKVVAYYVYPQNSLIIFDEIGVYNVSLEVYAIEGIIPQRFNASLWLNKSGQYTQQVKIINGNIELGETSKITINTGGYLSLFINLTAPYPSTPFTWDLTIKSYLKYGVNDIVTVNYPIRIMVTSK
ncbi:MAG: hypothetical protein QXR39_06415 [Candidatus Methanomethylicia archaeon]